MESSIWLILVDVAPTALLCLCVIYVTWKERQRRIIEHERQMVSVADYFKQSPSIDAITGEEVSFTACWLDDDEPTPEQMKMLEELLEVDYAFPEYLFQKRPKRDSSLDPFLHDEEEARPVLVLSQEDDNGDKEEIQIVLISSYDEVNWFGWFVEEKRFVNICPSGME